MIFFFKPGLGFAIWNFGHWNLFVIWGLLFGISTKVSSTLNAEPLNLD